MKPVLRCLLLLTAMALFIPHSSEAQERIFGAGDTVFDPSNFIRNTVTAAQMVQQVKQMVLQVKNSDNEVQMMLQNLLTALDQRYYPLDTYYALLLAEEGKAGPRPGSARTLDYTHGDLQPTALDMYSGFRMSDHYFDRSADNSDTALNTISAGLGRLHVNAGADAEDRYHGTRDGIANTSAAAQGQLQAEQTNNAAILFVADGIQRVEKSTAEIANIQAVSNAYTLQKEAWGEGALSYSLHLAGADTDVMPLYNGGAGGIKYVGTYQGGGF
jgi:conjugal transfer/entry exclusion protein